jgi:2-desacetyl-2-hydroxyethyl bacteriochlorophyllide A dehydrogenase
MSTRQTLYFARPYHVEVHSEALPLISPHQVLVQTHISAISAGTELLFYRGQVPPEMSIDATLTGMDARVAYPLAYGYCSAGEVISTGSAVDGSWLGQRVFAFHPHTSHFAADPSTLLPIPDDLTYEQAVFLPNMETAVNFVMDARPLIGERVLLFGLGIVGLLTSFLLHQFPLAKLGAVDVYAKRRTLAHQFGVKLLFSPDALSLLQEFEADLILEISSNPAALESAIQVATFGTRIVIGSWYGNKVAHLSLGGHFHRNRIQLISSQVSTLDGQFSNRWDKQRRLALAWQQLQDLPTDLLITHRLPLTAAGEAYHLLDKEAERALQILFTY